MIDYEVEAQTLYEQSRDCKWCYMLITESDLPKSFEDFQPSGYTGFHVSIEFHAPLQADSAKINSLRVSLELLGVKESLNILRVHRLAAWSKPGENSPQIPQPL